MYFKWWFLYSFKKGESARGRKRKRKKKRGDFNLNLASWMWWCLQLTTFNSPPLLGLSQRHPVGGVTCYIILSDPQEALENVHLIQLPLECTACFEHSTSICSPSDISEPGTNPEFSRLQQTCVDLPDGFSEFFLWFVWGKVEETIT